MNKEKNPPIDVESKFRDEMEKAWDRINTKIKKKKIIKYQKKKDIGSIVGMVKNKDP